MECLCTCLNAGFVFSSGVIFRIWLELSKADIVNIVTRLMRYLTTPLNVSAEEIITFNLTRTFRGGKFNFGSDKL